VDPPIPFQELVANNFKSNVWLPACRFPRSSSRPSSNEVKGCGGDSQTSVPRGRGGGGQLLASTHPEPTAGGGAGAGIAARGGGGTPGRRRRGSGAPPRAPTARAYRAARQLMGLWPLQPHGPRTARAGLLVGWGVVEAAAERRGSQSL
jgi:hypothetical protein